MGRVLGGSGETEGLRRQARPAAFVRPRRGRPRGRRGARGPRRGARGPRGSSAPRPASGAGARGWTRRRRGSSRAARAGRGRRRRRRSPIREHDRDDAAEARVAHLDDAGCASKRGSSACAVAWARSSRTGRVRRPRSARNASSGAGIAPRRLRVDEQRVVVPGVRDDDGAHQHVAVARRGTSSRSARRCPRRPRAVAGAAGWRTCCRPRRWRPRPSRPGSRRRGPRPRAPGSSATRSRASPHPGRRDRRPRCR